MAASSPMWARSTAGRQSVSGSELAYGWKDRLAAAGVRFHEEHVEAVRAQGRRRIVETDRGRYRAKAVVAATGARLRRLGVPGEEELTGRGVSQCAFCDAGFFRDTDVAVVGGGDAALQEALHLAGCARSCFHDRARRAAEGAGRAMAHGRPPIRSFAST